MDAEIAAEIAPGARFGPHDDQFLDGKIAKWWMLFEWEKTCCYEKHVGYFGILHYTQLMVNCWFGFLGSPYERDC